MSLADELDAIAQAASAVALAESSKGATQRMRNLGAALEDAGDSLAVVIAAAQYADRYGRVGAPEYLDRLRRSVHAWLGGE